MSNLSLKNKIDEMPVGLERAVLRALSYHLGKEHAVNKEQLIADAGMNGFVVGEREIRLAINELRHAGEPICSSSGSSGYWIAEGWDELSEFLERELHSRAMDMLRQENVLRMEASRRWGKDPRDGQLPLF